MTAHRKTCLRIVLWAAVAVWMVLIFWFSAEQAPDSEQTSGRIVRWLLTHFDKSFLSLPLEERLLKMEGWSFVVRKLAHFCIFAGLGFLCFAAFSVDLPVSSSLTGIIPFCIDA